MLDFIDIKVNQADDIVIDGSDIKEEFDTYKNIINNASRRLSSRVTDNIFVNEISLGLESYLQQKISDITLSEVESEIHTVLSQHGLLNRKDYNVLFDTSSEKVGVLVSFNLPSSPKNKFSIYIDKLNQKVYR